MSRGAPAVVGAGAGTQSADAHGGGQGSSSSRIACELSSRLKALPACNASACQGSLPRCTVITVKHLALAHIHIEIARAQRCHGVPGSAEWWQLLRGAAAACRVGHPDHCAGMRGGPGAHWFLGHAFGAAVQILKGGKLCQVRYHEDWLEGTALLHVMRVRVVLAREGVSCRDLLC